MLNKSMQLNTKLNKDELETYKALLKEVQLASSSSSSNRKYVLESLDTFVQIMNARCFITVDESDE